MPTAFHVLEMFAADVTLDDGGEGFELRWRVWKYDTATQQPVESTASEVLTALAATVSYGAELVEKPALKCYELTRTRDEDSELWTVTARYKSPSAAEKPDDFQEFMRLSNGSGADNPENPFGPEHSFDSQEFDDYRPRDLKNKAFVNFAGVPYQNVPPIKVSIKIDRVTVNLQQLPDRSQEGMCDGPRLLVRISGQSAEHQNRSTGTRTKYYRTTYEVWTHPDRDWADEEILEVGYVEIGVNPETNKKEIRNIIDPSTGDSVSSPVPLLPDGRAAPQGTEPKSTKYRVRKETTLRIPFMN